MWRDKGLKYFAIWLFGGLPIDVLAGTLILLDVLYFFSSDSVLASPFAFTASCTVLFCLYFWYLRDKIVRLYLYRWLK